LTQTSPPEPATRLALVRFSGDISIKAAKTKQRFVRLLADNVVDALRAAGIEHRVRRDWGRMYVEAESPLLFDILPRVFGVQSVSPVERRKWSQLKDIVAAGHEIFREEVAGKTFAVRGRRGGNTRVIPFDSMKVERELGTALLPYATGVDLGDPETEACVEVHPGEAYFFSRTIPARGGLPVGVQGHALSLVSGGFDSAVASWQLLRRGVSLDYLFFNLGGSEHRDGVLRVMKVISDLWSYGSRPVLHEVDFQPLVHDIQSRTSHKYWQILLKRQMLRSATLVARDLGVQALITGDSVGQVSSQTLQNIAVVSRATHLPVLRPLVGSNKDEIVEMARAIGTYASSATVEEYCGLAGRRPATSAAFSTVANQEALLDAELLERLTADRISYDLRALDLEATRRTDLEVEEIPPGAVLVDLRPRAAFDAWHPAEALHLEFTQALKAYRSFDRSQTYLLYCEIGFKSAHLAELMRDQGFEAFHLKHGIRQLLKRSAEADLLVP
jgi:thiamine biosynthesis protein ThiI